MKALRLSCIFSLLLLMGVIMPSCCDDIEPRDPTTRQVRLHVDVDSAFTHLRDVTITRSDSVQRRYTVVIFQNADIIQTHVSHSPDFELKVPVGQLRYTAFVDFVPSGSLEDWHFFTDEYQELLLVEKNGYRANDPSIMAYHGFTDMLMEKGRDIVDVNILATPAMGQYRLLATDTPDYEVGHIKVVYNKTLPSAIHGYTGEICYAWVDAQYTCQPQHDDVMCFDNVYAPREEAPIHARIEVYDTEGHIRARMLDVEIPMERGKTTNIRGDFYTTFEKEPGSGGGLSIGIDPEFSEVFVIEI